MKILWDEPKRLANIKKHGLDFADLNEHSSATPWFCRRTKTVGTASEKIPAA
jgi:uncharacterized DUF497 family protein